MNINQSVLPVMTRANEILGVIAIQETQFVGNETNYQLSGLWNPTIRLASMLRTDGVTMRFMVIDVDDADPNALRKEHVKSLPNFQSASDHLYSEGRTWVMAHQQHIPPDIQRFTALDRILSRVSYD